MSFARKVALRKSIQARSLLTKLAKIAIITAALLSMTGRTYAINWVVNVVKINSYSASNQKFVVVRDGIGSACVGGALTFDSVSDAGKTLYALLLTALVSGKQVELNINDAGYGCNILEAYILR
jgi:hypothetical protein